MRTLQYIRTPEELPEIPMSSDPIIDELDRLRAEQMESYEFDFEAFYRDLKEQERLSGQPIQAPAGGSGR
jgi:hypothetical protein